MAGPRGQEAAVQPIYGGQQRLFLFREDGCPAVDSLLGILALRCHGQVLLARAVDEPRTIFVIQIEKQAQDKEQMSARYAVIHD
jgi:hypothetical protein